MGAEKLVSLFVVALVLLALYLADEVGERGEHRKFLVQSAFGLTCVATSLINPHTDFSYLSKPNYTFPDGVTRTFRKLSDIYTPGFTIQNELPCQNGTKIIVTVLSAPGNKKQRAAIRATWGKTLEEMSNGTAKIVFVVGQTWPKYQRYIDRDVAQYGDIVQCKVLDGDRLSAVLKEYCMVEWVAESCPLDNVTHALKVDDDVYVIAENLIDYVNGGMSQPSSICGMRSPGLCGGWDSSDKWHTINSSSPPDTYPYWTPPYVGGSYLYTRDVAEKLVEAGNKSFFWDMPGDQYVTGILAEQARNVTRYHEIKLQYQFGDTALDALPEGVFKMLFSSAIVIQHNYYRVPKRRHLTPEMMYDIHRILYGEKAVQNVTTEQ